MTQAIKKILPFHQLNKQSIYIFYTVLNNETQGGVDFGSLYFAIFFFKLTITVKLKEQINY